MVASALRIACSVIVLSLSGPAMAADASEPAPSGEVERARAAFQRASDAFKIGRFEEALQAYEEAYALKQLPELLFNVGQCHFQLGHHERAVFFYQRYLAEKKNAPNRTLVERRIAEAEAKLAEEKKLEAARLEAERLAREAAAWEAAEAEAEASQRRLAEQQRADAAKAAAADAARRATEADARARAEQAERDSTTQMYLWGGVGVGAVLVLATGVVAALALQPPPATALPSGSLGTVDRRGGG